MENLTIKTVVHMTGLSEFTLRAWEKRYQAVAPKRNRSGRRAYEFSDVEKLRLLKSLNDSGQSIGQIAHLPLLRLKSLYNEVAQNTPVVRHFSSNEIHPQNNVQTLLEKVKRFDLQAVTSQLRSAQLQMNTRTFLIDLVSPLLAEIGKKVNSGELDVFHEHATSSILRNVLSGLLYLTEQSVVLSTRPPIILSTPENDLHEFGILICAILAMLNGSKVLYLGPNLPAASVAKACETVESPLVVLGTAAPSSVVSEKELQDYFIELSQSLPTSTRIWIGGPRARELKGIPALRNAPLHILKDLEGFERSVAHFMNSKI